MRILAAITLAVLTESCGPAPAGATPIQGGASLFAPAASQLGAGMAADLKARDAAAFQRYIHELGGKEESDLARKVATEVLSRYADALSISAAMEAELKSGKFDDVWNRKKVRSALGKFVERKEKLPEVCRVAVEKVQSGEWGSGLQLEFAARMIEGELAFSKK